MSIIFKHNLQFT